MPLRTDLANLTPALDEHPAHHNALAAAVNDVVDVRLPALKRGRGLVLTDYLPAGWAGEDATGYLQEAADDLPVAGGHLLIPNIGFEYALTGPVLFAGKQDVVVEFAGGATLAPTTLGELIFDLCQTPKIVAPRFRVRSGDPLSLLRLRNLTWHAIIEDPKCWWHKNIPANADFIIVEGDSYWAEIVRPLTRKNTGMLTGQIRRVVSFLTHSNAGRVLGGAVSNFDTGVYVNDCNATEVAGGAYEAGEAAVQLDGSGGLGSTHIHDLRLESVSCAVDITAPYSNYWSPVRIGPLRNQVGGVAEGDLIRNPNGHRLHDDRGGQIVRRSHWGAMPVGFVAQASNDQSILGTPLIALEQRPLTAPQTALTVEASAAAGTLIVDSVLAKNDYPAFPAAGALRIGAEMITYTSVDSTTPGAHEFRGCVRGAGGTTAAIHVVGRIVRDSLNQVFAVDTTGVLHHRSSGAGLPAPPDERVLLHHRARSTQLVSWDPTNPQCNVSLTVGDGAGGTRKVLTVYMGSVRPGVDNAIDMGLAANRWRHLFMSGTINHQGTLAGFYGATPAAKQSIAGSRGGNAALADLLTKLATVGLITDGTTA